MTRFHRAARRFAAPPLLLVAIGLPLAGCGKDTPASADRESAAEQAGLKFARCMRENGIDVKDPRPGGGVEIGIRPGNEGRLKTAEKACRKHLRGLERPMDREDAQKLQDAALKHARCMREQGIDFPDPQFSGGRVKLGGPGLDPDDPAFQAADKACRGLLPGGGPSGRAPVPSGGGGGGDVSAAP